MTLDNYMLYICKIKKNIVKLDTEKLEEFKAEFYSNKYDFDKWKLNLLWEYIWDDKTIEEVNASLRKRGNYEQKARN